MKYFEAWLLVSIYGWLDNFKIKLIKFNWREIKTTQIRQAGQRFVKDQNKPKLTHMFVTLKM